MGWTMCSANPCISVWVLAAHVSTHASMYTCPCTWEPEYNLRYCASEAILQCLLLVWYSGWPTRLRDLHVSSSTALQLQVQITTHGLVWSLVGWLVLGLGLFGFFLGVCLFSNMGPGDWLQASSLHGKSLTSGYYLRPLNLTTWHLGTKKVGWH